MGKETKLFSIIISAILLMSFASPSFSQGLPSCEDSCNQDFDACIDAGTDPAVCQFILASCLANCGPPTGGCASDLDCDDGRFCNGSETCNTTIGLCRSGIPPNPDDGVSCTDDSCDEINDVIDNTANDTNCDNGLFCDGSETCDPITDCQLGTPPVCDDGDVCTGDESCNETLGCFSIPPPLPLPQCQVSVGGEMISVETTPVLLAGAQTSASWMIPVIVSAIGIGIVIARKF